MSYKTSLVATYQQRKPFSKMAHRKIAVLWVCNHGHVDEAITVDIDSAEGVSDTEGVDTFGDVKAVTTNRPGPKLLPRNVAMPALFQTCTCRKVRVWCRSLAFQSWDGMIAGMTYKTRMTTRRAGDVGVETRRKTNGMSELLR